MIKISAKEKCCGCGACYSCCPQKCISLRVDNEGFLYPFVNEAECIDCNLCKKVCPMLQSRTNDTPNLEVYIAYASDKDIRKNSSSGGMFSLFAEYVIRENGVVIGAAFDEQFTVHHVVVESIDDLSVLRGSKYMQSRIENTYQITKNFLESGRKVLFTGTPCQIEGLNYYLGNNYDNLITVDILCHGVSSPLVWKKYLSEQEKKYGANAQEIIFRHKKYGWKKYAVLLKFFNGNACLNIFSEDSYMRLFLSNICLRPSCHACPFKNLHRNSDISIGDCWGVQAHSPEMDDDLGTSVVLIHSLKGCNVFEYVSDRIVKKQINIDTVLPPTADSRKSVSAHRNREKFFKQLNQEKSIEQLLKLTKKPLSSRFEDRLKRTVKNMIFNKTVDTYK